MRHLFSFIKFFTTLKAIFGLLRELPQFLTNLLRFKGAVFVGYSLAEYLATIRFLELKQKHRTDYNIIFLNLLAHSQHYYWKSKDLNQLPELKCTLYYVDKILGLLLDSLGPNERVIITNALSQTNTKNDPVWILYRQNDHKTLLDAIDIPPRKIEECMTNDAHLFFETVEATIRAKNTLTNVTINGEPLFQVESYPENPLKLFYIVRFSNEVIGKPQFTEGNKSYDFLEFFTAIVRRTGKHNGLGTVFSNIDNLALRGNLARATDQNPAPNQKVTNHELGQILANL